MFREYPNNVSLNGRGFIEQIGGYLLDGVAMSHKLRLPRDAWRSPYLCKLIHRGVADVTFDRFAAVHHRKCERWPLLCPPIRPHVSGIEILNPRNGLTRMRLPIVSVEGLP